ncbi:MAG: beta-galactosidase [Bacteroidales bacterium]|nr:beta-galactosidase [Bacteroidales bacterium]
MNKKRSITWLAVLVIMMMAIQPAWSQSYLQEPDWHLNTRLSYYTNEEEAEALLVVPEDKLEQKVSITLSLNGKLLFKGDTIPHERILRFPIQLKIVSEKKAKLVAWIEGADLNKEIVSFLYKLPAKSNGVQIDRLTGGLLTNGLPYYPFGFYCYSPVQPTLAEEEVVRGFNMMSPYQRIEYITMADRKAYLDRCAQLGMRVHYNLLSVAGGGGVGSSKSKAITAEEKRQLLIDEINTFKDHPALLAWYISDEPTGHGENPDSLAMVYDLIKSLDPYHPITIVFMAPAQARKYASAMDIVMADPYPVPNQPIRSVGTVAKNLKREFIGEKPVWIVPQAFGGGEWWGREPSSRELRAMTWLSIVEGATGIQYFVRHGQNGFPKSTATWGECGKMALEVQEILPFLTSGMSINAITTPTEGLRVTAREYQGDLLIIAVNEEKDPKKITISTGFGLDGSKIEVLYEDRQLPAVGDSIIDLIDGYGRRVYRLSGYTAGSGVDDNNLILDPGFENISSPGIPSACYVSVGEDKGANCFLDTRMVHEGRHSLRITTPETDKGMSLSFFPVRMSSGSGYSLSIWARLDTNSIMPMERTFWQRLFRRNKYRGSFFTLSIGSYANEKFRLTSDWARYTIYFNISDKGTKTVKLGASLELNTQGTAWFDQLELRADPVIDYGLDEKSNQFKVSAKTFESNGILRYTLNNSMPTANSAILDSSLLLDHTANVTVGVFEGDELLNWSSRSFFIHKAIGKSVSYRTGYTGRYSAGGEFGLVDGIRGTRDYLDGKWQGFMAKDLVATIDLGELTTVHKVITGCLQDTRSWIFMPSSVQVSGSLDGEEYVLLGEDFNDIDQHAPGAIKKDFKTTFPIAAFRYIRVRAKNIGLCPDWHNGKGNAAFLFVDELVVE